MNDTINNEISNENNSYLLIKEFDKKANEIRVMAQVHKWFGIIFEALMIVGAICIINIIYEK